jgi:hypothetical protein
MSKDNAIIYISTQRGVNLLIDPILMTSVLPQLEEIGEHTIESEDAPTLSNAFIKRPPVPPRNLHNLI